MDKERILTLADVIEKEEIEGVRFKMHSFYCKDQCGTTACIAGHAILLWGDEEANRALKHNAGRHHAAKILGLDSESKEVFDLFYTSMEATPKEAAWKLRQFAETGKVPKLI